MNGNVRELPPDSNNLTGICPNCNLPSTFEHRGERRVSAAQAQRWLLNPNANNMSLKRVVVYQCRACHEGCVVVEQASVVNNQRRFEGIHWWPPPGAAQIDKSIPPELADAYREGMRCLGAASPHAAAVMYRRTIEGIVRDKGSEKAVKQLDNSDLPGALKIMAKEHALDATLADWAEDVRGLGNVGGHFDPLEEVNVEQATDLAHLVRQILRYLYEEPARRQRLRDSRAKAE
jgi:hypothetical protein